MSKKKIIRITTVPQSLAGLLSGQLRYMNQYFEVIAVSSSGEALDLVSERENVNTFAINMTRTISPLKDLVAFWKLYKLIKKEKPDLVHTHTPKAGILGMLAAYMAGVPNRLHTVAGMPLMEAVGFKRKVLDVVEKLTYACSSKIYPNSLGLKKIILDNKFTVEEKLNVIAKGSSNGIDTGYFSRDMLEQIQLDYIRSTYQLDESLTVFCFVGRIVGDKGINELVGSFVKLYNENPDIRLLLVGPFETDLDRLERETEKSISEHPGIIWTDFQNDVRPFLAISDIFAFPSYREGFPNVVMQAGAMDLPCIVSDINGCNEIIQDGVNGVIIPPKNSDKLYLSMKNLLINKKKREELSNNSRGIITSRYERQYVWDELLVEYKRVLG